MLLVSLVHQFIWPTFNLVFTRIAIFKFVASIITSTGNNNLNICSAGSL